MRCDEKGPEMATDCNPCSPNVRNRYFRGKLMTVADYQAEQLYMVQRRRVVNRMLLGWGVVRGFHVEPRGDALVISPGVALDPCGREVIACEPVTIQESDDILWLRDGKCGPEASDPFKPGCYILSAHYAERHVDGVRVSTGCDESECETNHICETVVYSLKPIDPKRHPIRVLDCAEIEPQPDDRTAPFPTEGPRVGPVDNRGQGNLCLHDPLDWKDRRFKACETCDLTRHGDLDIDFGAGVALAIVCFKAGDCDKLAFTEVQAIIRGCQLTRIKDIGWRNWHDDPTLIIGRRPFFHMFIKPADGSIPPEPNPDDFEEDDEPADKPTYPAIDTRFWICLSAPIQIASLNRDVISITLLQPASKEAVGNMVRVPIAGIWHQATLKGDPPNTTRCFRPFVTHQFWAGEIRRGVRSGFASETLVEIRVHGDRIIDWAGRPIDANSIAHHLPSGNQTPGGEFLSSWRVKKGGKQLPPRGTEIPWEAPAKTGGATPAQTQAQGG